MNRILKFIIIIFVPFIYSCKKDECKVCDSNIVTSFNLFQQELDAVNFEITYNDLGKVSFINQSGYYKIPNPYIDKFRNESVEFYYNDAKLEKVISTFSELNSDSFSINSPNFINGIRYKSYYEIIENDLLTVLEVLDSTEINGNITHNFDTTTYEFRFLNSEHKLTKITYPLINLETQFSYFLDNNLNLIVYLDELGEPLFNEFELFEYDGRTNPLKLINDNIGFTYFNDRHFLSNSNFVNGSRSISSPGTGPSFFGRNEVKLDCNENPIEIENVYLINEKLCE